MNLGKDCKNITNWPLPVLGGSSIQKANYGTIHKDGRESEEKCKKLTITDQLLPMCVASLRKGLSVLCVKFVGTEPGKHRIHLSPEQSEIW